MSELIISSSEVGESKRPGNLIWISFLPHCYLP